MIFPKYQKINSLYKREDNGKFTKEYSLPMYKDLYYNFWEGREKIDGTNIRICWDGNKVDFRGKTDKAILPKPLLEYLKESFPEELLAMNFPSLEYDEAVILYGEGYGNKIQANGRAYVEDWENSPVGFCLFDILNLYRDGERQVWWDDHDVVKFATENSIKSSPVVFGGSLYYAELQTKQGFNSLFAPHKRLAEGMILRPLGKTILDRWGKRIIVKTKTSDYK